jgi:predicted MPP superfamily phosphohydrolase
MAQWTLFYILSIALILTAWRPNPWNNPPRAAVLILLLGSLLAVFWPTSLAAGPIFGIMAYFGAALFILLPAVLFVWGWLHRGWQRALAIAASALLWAVGINAYLIEPYALEVNFHAVEARVTTPLRIVVLSDIQTDAPGAFEEDVFRRVKELVPDLVVFPGDYIQVESMEEALDLGDKLRSSWLQHGPKSPLGGVAVGGDSDRPSAWTAIWENTTIRASVPTVQHDLGSLFVTALAFEDGGNPDMRVDPASKVHIVVAHRPEFALGDVDADLLIAGHTHGGQVRLPFIGPLLTFSQVPRAWAAGRTELPGGRTLIVSRGLGMERGPAPRIRFLCRPEIVVIDLVPFPET